MSNRPFQGKIVTMPDGERYRARVDTLFFLDQGCRCDACEANYDFDAGIIYHTPCVVLLCWDDENIPYVWERLTLEEVDNGTTSKDENP